MTLCLAILPSFKLRVAAIAYSNALAQLVETPMRLGSEYLPHCTLAHIAGQQKTVGELWHSLRSSIAENFEIPGSPAIAVYPIPTQHEMYYVRLEIDRSPTLQQAHSEAVRVATQAGAEITNQAGWAWRPHLTLAVIKSLPDQLPHVPEGLTSPWAGKLALGELREFRQLASISYFAS
jgi:2'-5' RNA ligase